MTPIEAAAKADFESKVKTVSWDGLLYQEQSFQIELMREKVQAWLDASEPLYRHADNQEGIDPHEQEVWLGDPDPNGCEMGMYVGEFVRVDSP